MSIGGLRLIRVKTLRLAGDRWEAVTASTPVARAVDPATLPFVTPWASSDLQRIVFEDVFGSEIPVNTRSAAMKLPALARGVNLLKATIGRLQLQRLRGADVIEPAPWFYATPDGTSPQLKLAWTVDDLIFYGWSCWWRVNGADGFPLSTTRLNQGDWSIDSDNRVTVFGSVVEPDQVILIPGLHEGILSFGADSLRQARDLYANVSQRVANPVPAVDLHQTQGETLSKPDREDLIALWVAARQGANGGVAYTSPGIEAREMGMSADAQLMIEARNAAAVDLARLVGVHAGLVDATTPKSSLNYETQTGRNQEFVDFDVQAYTLPITARLSLDDVCPHGQRIALDFTDLTGPTPAPTGPALVD